MGKDDVALGDSERLQSIHRASRASIVRLLIRAACGYPDALAQVLHRCRVEPSAGERFAAIVLCDPAPPPLTALAALAARRPALPALARRARQALPGACLRLIEPDSAALRTALQLRLPWIIQALDAASDAAERRRDPAMEPPRAALDVFARIAVAEWRALTTAMRTALINALMTAPDAAAELGGIAWADASDEERAIIVARASCSPSAAARLLQRIGRMDQSLTMIDVRRPLVIAVSSDPFLAAIVGGAIWSSLAAGERIVIAQSAARAAMASAALMERIGGDGWSGLPSDARAALIARVCETPLSAVMGGISAWAGMTAQERARIAHAAAREANASAALMERIGDDGWSGLPSDARTALLRAATANAAAACRSGAIWGAATQEERMVLVRAVVADPASAARLMAQIGVLLQGGENRDAREVLSAEERALLVQAAMNSPNPAETAGMIWGAATTAERIAMARAVACDAWRAGELMAYIGALKLADGSNGWAKTPFEARQALLAAATREPSVAAISGGAIWMAATSSERLMIASAVASCPKSAARLLERIGGIMQQTPDGWHVWASLPVAARSRLLASMRRDPSAAAHGGGAAWMALNVAEQNAVVAAAARHGAAVADLMLRIGARGWTATPESVRARLVQAIGRDPLRAARVGAALWSVLSTDEQERIARAAARHADAVRELTTLLPAAAWRAAPAKVRTILLRSLRSDLRAMAAIIARFWTQMAPNEQSYAAHAIARDAGAAASLIAAIGETGWSATPLNVRAILWRAAIRDPWTAAHCGAAIWKALTLDERAEIVQSAARDASAAASLLLGVASAHGAQRANDADAAVDAAFWGRLLCATLASDAAEMLIAQERRNGAPWRPWMEFVHAQRRLDSSSGDNADERRASGESGMP